MGTAETLVLSVDGRQLCGNVIPNRGLIYPRPVSDLQVPTRLVFRVPAIAVLAPLLLAVGAIPFAFGAPFFYVIFAVPLALIVWILRYRTTADADGLTVRRALTKRALPWSSLKGLRLTKRASVRAVLTDDTEVPLPAVRTRHLPALALISGGRLDDPLTSVSEE